MDEECSMDTENLLCSKGENSIKSNLPYLCDHLDVDCVVDLIKSELNSSLRIALRDATSRDEKFFKLTRELEQPHNQGLYEVFLKVLAGVQPEVFRQLTGQDPTVEQALYCVQTCSTELRRTVLSKEHELDRAQDRAIDLDNNYVTLHLHSTQDGDDVYGSIEGHDAQIPSHYQAYVQSHGTEMKAEDILTSAGKKVLLRGRAGIGKSTTMQYLGRKWARHEWADDYPVVVLLRLRSLMRKDNQMSVFELLTQHGLYQIENLPVQWVKNNCEHIVIMLDGLDEVKQFSHWMQMEREITNVDIKGTPQELCINILRGNLLPGCAVISTSRPFAGLRKLPKEVTIEVLGLTEQGVKKFVEKNTPSAKSENIKEALVQNPTLMSVCGITFYCMLICHLLSDNDGLAKSSTNTYTRLLAYIILSYATRELDENSTLKLRKYFPKLSKLAFHGIFGTEDGPFKLSFSQGDLMESDIDNEVVEQAREAGILHSIEGGVYEFAHLSIQEMFAAGHFLVSDTFQEKDLDKLMERLTEELNFNMLLLYMYGLKYDNEYEEVQVLKIAMSVKDKESNKTPKNIDKMFNSFIRRISKKAKKDNDQSLMLQAMNLAYESQSMNFAHTVASEIISEDTSLYLSGVRLTAVDVAAILYVCESVDNLQSISFPQTGMDDTSVQQVCKFMSENENVIELDITGSHIGAGSLRKLQELLKENLDFKSLCLNDCNLRDEDMIALKEGLKDSGSLEKLFLNGNSLTDSGMKTLGSIFEECPSLKVLEVKSNKLSNKSLPELVKLSLSAIDLRIDVSGNAIHPDMVQILFHTSKVKEHMQGDVHLKGWDDSSIKMYFELWGQYSMMLKSEAEHNVSLGTDHKLHSLRIENSIFTSQGMACIFGNIKKLNFGSLFLINSLMQNAETSNLSDTPVVLTSLTMEHCRLDSLTAANILMSLNRSHITSLDLSHNYIRDRHFEEFAAGLSKLSELISLNLSFNDIGSNVASTLAKSVSMLESLQHLDLSENMLGNEGIQSISTEALPRLQRLRTIALRANHFTEMGTNAILQGLTENAGLEALDLSENKIGSQGGRSVGGTVHRFQDLSSLALRSCNLGRDGMRHIMSTMNKLNKLEVLDVGENGFGQDSSESFFELLGNMHSLKKLYIDGNNIGSDGIKYLSKWLSCTSGLQLDSLNISKNNIGKEGMRHLVNALSQVQSLTNLQISFNALESKGAEYLSTSLAHLTNLFSLDVGNNNIGSKGAEYISMGLKCLHSLKYLNLEENHIGSEGAKHIAESLIGLISLTDLQFSGNDLSDKGCEHISNALSQLTLLESLSLDNNNLGSDAARHLSNSLFRLPKLHSLTIGHNHIRAKGMEYLADALATLYQLSTLELRENYLKDQGAMHLAKALVSLDSLMHLGYANNSLGRNGIQAISQNLSNCKWLSSLNLARNSLGAEGAKHISETLQDKQFFLDLDLSENWLGDKGVNYIFRALDRCKLETLNLANNQITGEGLQFLGCSFLWMLKSLNLGQNKIKSDGAKILAEFLKNFSSLRTLDVRCNELGPLGGKHIAEAFKYVPYLKVLEIGDNKLGPKGCISVSENLIHIRHLSSLVMSGNQFGDATEHLSLSIRNLNYLQTLHLSHCGITPSGSKHIADAFRSLTSLETLWMGENDIGNSGVKFLCAGLKHTKNLKTFGISKNGIDDQGAMMLSEVLASIPTLRHLYIGRNQIREHGMKHISQALLFTLQLETLSISRNEVGTKGIQYLSKSLPFLPALTDLNLSGNLVRTESLVYLANTLPYLKRLYLTGNQLHVEGSKALSRSLPSLPPLPYLEALVLTENQIGPEGCRYISESFPGLVRLRVLNMNANEITDEGANHLARHLGFLQSLRLLHLSNNQIGHSGAKNVALALRNVESIGKVYFLNNPGIGHSGQSQVNSILGVHTCFFDKK